MECLLGNRGRVFSTLIDKYDIKVGAEIGVDAGRFSANLLVKSKIDLIYGIDCWLTRPYRYTEAVRRLAKYGNRCTLIHKTSEEAAVDFDDESLDFVYIDADHTYAATKQDIDLWWPKVKFGGVFSGHDYFVNTNSGDVGVVDAVEEFAEEHRQQIQLTRLLDGNRESRRTIAEQYWATPPPREERILSWWSVKQRSSKAYILI